jgi:ABC-type transporter lipoprotein component MlaA
VNTINTRSLYLEQLERAKESSLDYYGFARNAYMQRRAALVRDEALPESETDDLYDTDFVPEEGR